MTDTNLKILTDYDYPVNNLNKLYNDKAEINFLKDNIFNVWNVIGDINPNYTRTYYVEGLKDDNKYEYILLYDNKYKKTTSDNKLILNDLNFDTVVSILKDGEIIILKENIKLGAIFGLVNTRNCGIQNESDMEIICVTNDTKRVIGRYPVVDGKYTIPNLYVDQYYDIILVDKTRAIEQQILSYRKPNPY